MIVLVAGGPLYRESARSNAPPVVSRQDSTTTRVILPRNVAHPPRIQDPLFKTLPPVLNTSPEASGNKATPQWRAALRNAPTPGSRDRSFGCPACTRTEAA